MARGIKEILTEYERKRDIREYEAEERKKALYEEIPELVEIDSKVKYLGLKSMREVIKNPAMADEIKNEIEVELNELKVRKYQLFKERNIPKDYLKIKYGCEKCKDKGFTENGHKCSCLTQRLINESYKVSNLENIIEKQNFNTFNIELFSDVQVKENKSPKSEILRIVEIVKKFISNFDKANGENLLFYGGTGVGKTFMSSCIAKELLDSSHIVIYQTSFDITKTMENYKFKKGIDRFVEEAYNSLFSCDLLIIDDLGTELANSFVVSEFFNLINSRILSNKKIIISSNLRVPQIMDVYTQRVFSRIVGHFILLEFIGKDLRWE